MANILKVLLKILCCPLYKVHLTGVENLKLNEKNLLIANQSSHWDLWILLLTLPPQINYVVDKKRKNNIILKCFKNIIFIDFHNTEKKDLLTLILKDNSPYLLFPEISFSEYGGLPLKLHDLSDLFIDKEQYSITTVGIRGSQNIYFSQQNYDKKCWRNQIFINILTAEKIALKQNSNSETIKQSSARQLHDLMTNALFETWDYDKLLIQSLIEQRKKYGWNYTIVEDAERIPMNYGQLLTRIFVLAKALHQHLHKNSITEQKNIALFLPNTRALLVSFFSVQLIDKLPVILNFSLGANVIKHCCHIADIKTIITSKKFIKVAQLDEVIQTLQQSGIIINYLEDIAESISLTDKLSSLLYSFIPQTSCNKLINKYSAASATAFDAKKTAVILFTSGSENLPKGVQLSHQNLQANRLQSINVFPLSQKHDRILNSLPMFHSFGLTVGTLLPLLMGIRNILYPSPLHFKAINEIIYESKITFFASTNSFLHGHEKNADDCDFHHLRFIIAGAEKVKHLTQEKWLKRFGIPIYEGYGVSECSPVISVNTPKYNKMGTVGRLLPAIKHNIKTVEDIKNGGKLLIAGPNKMQGYLNSNADENNDDWYDTQDIVNIDDEGFITIVDRFKRFAKIAGEMISLTSIENHIIACWATSQHAIISQPHESRGEQLILITTQPKANRKELLQYAKSNGLAEIMIPKIIIPIDEIPTLGSGKVNYVQLTQWYEKNTDTGTQ